MKKVNDDEMKIYVYDGTFYAFLTVVFYAYETGCFPLDIKNDEDIQLILGANIMHIDAVSEKAERVMNKICGIVGRNGLFHIYKAFLSDVEGRERKIFDYIRLLVAIGKDASINYADKRVSDVYDLSRKTGNEAHLMRGFLRFSETKSGIYYAEHSPKTDCTELIAPHFKNRLSGMEFVINDLKRKKAAYWDKNELKLFYYDEFFSPETTENEEKMQQMWKAFYKKVAIKERENNKCRMTHMPKRFWRYMCEVSGEV